MSTERGRWPEKIKKMKRECSEISSVGSGSRKRSRGGDASKFKDDEKEVSAFAYAYLKSQNRNLWKAFEKSKRTLKEIEIRCDAMEARWAAQLALGNCPDGGEELAAERARANRLQNELENVLEDTQTDRLELELGPSVLDDIKEEKGDAPATLPLCENSEKQLKTQNVVLPKLVQNEQEFQNIKLALDASIATNASLVARCALAEAMATPLGKAHSEKAIEIERNAQTSLINSLKDERDRKIAEASLVQEKLKADAESVRNEWQARLHETAQAAKKDESILLSAPEAWQAATETERTSWTQMIEQLQSELNRRDSPTVLAQEADKKGDIGQLKAINASLVEEVDATATALETLRSNHTKLLAATAAILQQYRDALTTAGARSLQCRLLEEKFARFEFVYDNLKKTVADKEQFLQASDTELLRLRSSINELTRQRDQERAKRNAASVETLALKNALENSQAQFTVTLTDLHLRLNRANKDTETRIAKLKQQLSTKAESATIANFSEKAKPDQKNQAQNIIIKDLRAKLTCLVCSDREKTTVLTRCFHVFCRECIDLSISNRSRKCPACSKPVRCQRCSRPLPC